MEVKQTQILLHFKLQVALALVFHVHTAIEMATLQTNVGNYTQSYVHLA